MIKNNRICFSNNHKICFAFMFFFNDFQQTLMRSAHLKHSVLYNLISFVFVGYLNGIINIRFHKHFFSIVLKAVRQVIFHGV